MNMIDDRIIVSSNYREIDKLCNFILDSDIYLLGFDTEGMPVELIQFATDTHVYIFRIGESMRDYKYLPPSLLKLLSSRKIIKVGVDITQDNSRLKHDYNISMSGIIDIQDIATTLKLPCKSLNDLSIKFTGIPKQKYHNY